MKELNVDKRIITLILKHTLQIISESEQQELDLWRQADARHETVFEYLSEPENLEKEYRFRKEIDAEQSLERIKEKLWNEEKETKEVPLHAHRFTTYLYRAAAIIVLFIVGGAYWYHREYTRVTPPEISQEVQLAMEQSRERGVQAAEIITSGMPHQQVITDEERALYHVDEDFAEQLEEAKRITTYHNKEYWVTLPDGSLVHLNYNSRLIYPEKFGDRRDVILEGEAYLMVAKDKSRQFVVHTPKGDVKVYGTEFVVNTGTSTENGNDNKELTVVDRYIIRWVGIMHVITSEHYAFLVFRMNHYARGKITWLSQPFIPYGNLVEVASLIQTHDSMFHYVFIFLHFCRMIS